MMKNIMKKILAICCLIVIFSINTFSAVVSDNDGSSFVTKAEFENLKEDFDSQINNYNASIDNKIDGAIASYLAGIQTSKTTVLESLYNKTINSDSNSSRWIDISGIQPTTYDGKHINTSFFHTVRFGIARADFDDYCYSYIITNTNRNSAGVGWIADTDTSSCFFANKHNFQNTDYWYLQDTKIHNSTMNLFVNGTVGVGTNAIYTWDENKPPDSYTFDFSSATVPQNIDRVFYHLWKSVGSWSPESNVPGSISTEWADGTNYSNLAYNASGAVSTNDLYLVEYSERYTYDNSSSNITTKNPRNDSTRSGYNVYQTNGSGAIQVEINIFNWIYPYQKFIKKKFSDFINYYASYYADDIVYKYSGVPLFKVTEKGKVELTLKGVTSSGTYTLAIADSKFTNNSTLGLVNSNGKIVYTKTGLASNTNQAIEFDVERLLDRDGDIYYVKLQPETTGANVTLSQVGDIKFITE